MTKDSLRKLLSKFPYFLDKRESSNFYKSQDVTNKRFQEVYQSLSDVSESFKLEKSCLIWKEQSVPYDYFIHFVANYPCIKTVICYKNNEMIYRENYSEDDNVSSFIYVYDSTIENDGFMNMIAYDVSENEDDEPEEELIQETLIIPEDKFHIHIETYDELIIEKGFPENDTILGDIYDHDTSLDRLGELCNVPRKKYIPTDDYSHTEPTYNDRLSEDDYHYMNRLLNYLQKLHTTPLPILEIWKLYGLEASMTNRERYLLKLFDEDNHDFDYQTEHVSNWNPKKWEHKDGFADFENNLGKYFFASPNTNFPKKWRDITFNFKLMNTLGEELDEEYTTRILLNNTVLEYSFSGSSYFIPYSLLDEEAANTFRFIAYQDNNVIDEDTVEVNVQGCNNADYYVSDTGSDITGDGSRENPYHTLDKALENVSDVKNMIVVQGDINLTNPSKINNTCTILGCGNATVHNDISNRFFNIVGNKNLNLTLVDISLDSNGAIVYIKSSDYTNNNPDFNSYLTVLVNGGVPLINFELDKNNYYPDYDNMIVTGTMNSKEGNPIKNTSLKVILQENSINAVTDNNGNFTAIIPIRNLQRGIYEVMVSFEGTDTYLDTDVNQESVINKNPLFSRITYGDDITLTSDNHVPGDTVKFYNNNTLIETKTADTNGETSLIYSPVFGRNVIYISDDGVSVDEEWVIETMIKITDLPADYFITDLNIDSAGNLTFEKTPLSDFESISDLEGILLDVSVNGENIYLTRFASNYDDETILQGDVILLSDLEEMYNAITNLEINNSSLVCERMGNIAEGDD